MRTRTLILIAEALAIAGAVAAQDLAALYVAVGVGTIVYLLHAIEVKLNKLLDHHRITVWDSDIAKE